MANPTSFEQVNLSDLGPLPTPVAPTAAAPASFESVKLSDLGPPAAPNNLQSFSAFGTPVAADPADPFGMKAPPPLPPAGNSELGDLGRSAIRGAIVGLPSIIGKGLQFVGAPGATSADNPVYNAGTYLVQNSEALGNRPGLQVGQNHGPILNTLNQGIESVPQAAGAIGAGALVTALAPEAAIGGLGAGLITGSLTGGAMFGAAAGQDTIEKAKAKGLSNETALSAGRASAAATGATQTALAAVGGQFLGGAGSMLGKAVGIESAPLAADVLQGLTGNTSALGSVLKGIPGAGVEALTVNGVQAAAQAGIEQHYGIDTKSPGQAAADSVIPTLGQVAAFGLLGIPARIRANGKMQATTAVLGDATTPPAQRQALADQYAAALAKRGTPEAQAASQAFSDNAATAIQHGLPLPMDQSVLSPGTVTPPEPEAPPAPAPLALPNTGLGTLISYPDGSVGPPVDANGPPESQAAASRMRLNPGLPEGPVTPNTTVAFPDGSTSTQAEADARINALPENERVAARAQLYGYGEQPADAAPTPPWEQPPQLGYTPADPLVSFPDGTVGRQSEVAGYLASIPENQRTAAAAKLYGYGEQPADAAPVDPNAARAVTDISAAGQNIDGLSTQAQAYRAFEMRIKKLGIDQQPDLPSQVDAMDAAVADKTNGMSQGVRDRMSAVADKLRTEIPQEETPAAETPTETPAEPGIVSPDEQTPVVTNGPEAAPAEAVPPTEPVPAAETPPTEIPAAEPATPAADIPLADRPTAADQIVAGTAPPAQDALGNNIPTPTPENTAPSPAADTLGANIDAPIHEQAADSIANMGDVVNDLETRQQNGEDLGPLEERRLTDARALGANMADALKNPGKYSPEYLQDLVSYARETEKPYTPANRDSSGDLYFKAENPEAVDPGILYRSAFSNKLTDTLDHLTENPSAPWVGELAAKLKPFVTDTTIKRGAADPTMPGVAGVYKPNENAINIYPGGETEHTILHEASHAATATMINKAADMGAPKNQADAKLKSAYNDFEAVRKEATKGDPTGQHYGLTSAHEFAAELDSNPGFVDYLKGQGTGAKNLWTRTVDAVRRMLGLSVDSRSLLARAMEAKENFYSTLHSSGAEQFMKSPAGAAERTDDVLGAIGKAADVVPSSIAGKANRAVFKSLLGAETEQYISDMAHSNAALRAHGFTDHVAGMRRANDAKQIVAEELRTKLGDYVTKTAGVLRKVGGESQQRGMLERMSKITGEAVQREFDYKLNYADNKAARPGIDPADKARIDAVHRDFTQLQKSHPEVANAIMNQERLARGMLVNEHATILKNLMETAEGANRTLAATASRMDPADANYAAMQNRVANANVENLMAVQHAPKLDIMAPDLSRARIDNPTDKYYSQKDKALAARIEAAFAQARTLPEGSDLRANIGTLEKAYRAKDSNPYASLGRDGKYYVKVAFQNMDDATQAKLEKALTGSGHVLGNLRDQDHAFFRVDSSDEAIGLFNKMKAAGGDKIDLTKSSHNLLADKSFVNARGVDPALQKVMDALHKGAEASGATPEQTEAMKAAITRQVLSMLPETSARGSKMERQGVPGWNSDFLQNFQSRAQGHVVETAGLYTNRAFANATKGMEDAIGKMSNTSSIDTRERARMVADELNKRHALSLTSTDNSLVNTIQSLSNTFYLAASPGFLIRTMAQPFHRGLPAVGARHGFVQAGKEIARATPMALDMVRKLTFGGAEKGYVKDGIMDFDKLGYGNMDPAEKAFIQEMHDRGRLNLGLAQQLAAQPLAGSIAKQNAVRWLSTFAQASEMMNRLSLGMGAFRLAQKGTGVKGTNAGPKSIEANTDYAIRTVDRAMDNFDSDNTARYIGKRAPTGPLTPLATQFMNYSLQATQQLARTVQDGFMGKDPSTEGLKNAKEARREFAGIMAMTTMISGALGLPFVNAIAGIYNMLTKDEDDPRHGDIRIAATEGANSFFGDQVGGMIMHGLPRAADIDTSSFGLQDLLPGSEFLASRRQWKDRIADQSQQLMGPAINGLLDVGTGLSKMSDGYYLQGLQSMLPSGLKSYFKAVQTANHGYLDGKGNPINLPASGWDVALQAAGMMPADLADRNEANRDLLANNDLVKARQGVIKDQIYKAVKGQDPAATQSAIQAMIKFNQTNPLDRIPGIQQTMIEHAKNFAIQGASGGLSGAKFPLLRRYGLPGGPGYGAIPGQ